MSAPRLLMTCVAEDTPGFHARVEMLVGSARRLGGTLATTPIVVNLVGSADPAFSARMAAAGAEVRVVERVVHSGVAHANKLRMLELHEREDFDVLLALDCDIAVAADPAAAIPAAAIGVVPADVDPFTAAQWRGIFAGLGVEPGERTVRATATGRPMYPYFNSGVICVPREHCAALLRAWTQAMDDLDGLWRRDPQLIPPAQRFFADQIGLAIALRRGLPFAALSPALNFATHVRLHRPIVRDVQPALLHFHAEVDDAGFLLRPRCAVAVPAAERVNRDRAAALGIAYDGLRRRPLTHRPRRLLARVSARARRALSRPAPSAA